MGNAFYLAISQDKKKDIILTIIKGVLVYRALKSDVFVRVAGIFYCVAIINDIAAKY